MIAIYSIYLSNLTVYKFILVLLFFFILDAATAQVWTEMPVFPGDDRDDGVSFVSGNKGFCGTGLLPWFAASRDFYVFNFETESWSTADPMPVGLERQYACGFSLGNYGFVFGGVGNSGWLNDMWRYDIDSDAWNSMTPMPAEGRSGAASFQVGELAYVLGGRFANGALSDELWCYNLVSDTWEQMQNFPFGPRWRAGAAALNGKGYLAFGLIAEGQFSNELFEYIPETDSWLELPSFPGIGRTYTSITAHIDQLYAFGGLGADGTYYNDLWRYSISSQSWVSLAALPSFGRKGGMVMAQDFGFYYTTGINIDNLRLSETWKVDLTTNVESINAVLKARIFPNPNTGIFSFNVDYISPIKCAVNTPEGLLVYTSEFTKSENNLDLSHLPAGIYIINISGNEINENIRLIKL